MAGTYAQEKKQASGLDAAAQSQSATGAMTGSESSVKDGQMSQGVDLAHGALAGALEKGESAKEGSNPYGAFNYYKSSGGLGSSFFGLIDGKPIYEHTVGRILQLMNAGSTLNISYTDGDQPKTVTGRLFAVGKYQIIPDTLKAAQVAIGMKNDDLFSAKNQDLCFSQYLIGPKRPAIMAYLTGNGSLDAAAKAVAQEWASVGIKPGSTNNNGITGKASGLTSYYSGDGVNSASISYETIRAALIADKAAIEAGGIATNTVVHGSGGSSSGGVTATSSSSETAGASKEASAKVETHSIPESSVQIDIERAIRVNRTYRYSDETWKEIQSGVGLTGSGVDGICGMNTCQAIADWQATHGFSGADVDGICGPNTLAALRASGKAVTSQEASAKQTTSGGATASSGTTAAKSDSSDKQFKYFSIKELTHSDTAVARGLDNSPDKVVTERLSALITNCLDPLREAYGSPIRVNSGYRSPAVNRAVGGATNSQHGKGEAADLSTGSRATNKQLYNLVLELSRTQGFKFDQLINEYNYSWVHVSYSTSQTRYMAFSIGS